MIDDRVREVLEQEQRYRTSGPGSVKPPSNGDLRVALACAFAWKDERDALRDEVEKLRQTLTAAVDELAYIASVARDATDAGRPRTQRRGGEPMADANLKLDLGPQGDTQ